MLLSHSKKFIFFKTKKTGSTSVEIFFERFCVPQTNLSESTEELITDYGIVGSRMFKQKASDKFFNHMGAKKIRNLIDPGVFNSYHKITVVRNPYDKVVSMFWWHFKSSGKLNSLKDLSFGEIKMLFRKFVLSEENFPLDKHIYTIDGKIVADRILRHENLLEDLDDCCLFLEIPFEVNQLKKFKQARLRSEPYQDYYDSETLACVRNKFDWELRTFSYSF
jgi:hypothetical protein